MSTHKTKIILGGLCLAALVLVGVNYWVLTFIKAKNVRASEIRVDTAASDERRAVLFGTGDNDVASQIALLNTHVLGADDDAVAFIEDLEAKAKEFNTVFEIQSVAIDPPTDETKDNLTETVRLNVEVTGLWESVAQLLFALEHAPYRVVVSRAAFSRLEGTESVAGARWRLRAEFTVLKQKPIKP